MPRFSGLGQDWVKIAARCPRSPAKPLILRIGSRACPGETHLQGRAEGCVTRRSPGRNGNRAGSPAWRPHHRVVPT